MIHSENIKDIKEYVTEIIPEAVFLGSGVDGCVFHLTDKKIIKIIPNQDKAINEITSIRALEKYDSPLTPEIYAYGNFGKYTAIVRENLTDKNIENVFSKDFNKTGINVFIMCHMIHVVSLFNAGYTPYQALDNMITAFLQDEEIEQYCKRANVADSFERDDLILDNLIMSPEFIKNVGESFLNLKRSENIIASDYPLSNWGLTETGDIKLRDLSNFMVDDKNEIKVQIKNMLDTEPMDMIKYAKHIISDEEYDNKEDYIYNASSEDEDRSNIETIKDYIEYHIPGAEYCGAGADGVVFSLDGQKVLKVMIPSSIFHNFGSEEFSILKAMENTTASNMFPKAYSFGYVGPFKAFIRDDLDDASSYLIEFNQEVLDNLIDNIKCIANGSMTVTDIINEIKNNYNGDIEEDLESNPFLNEDFILSMVNAFNEMKVEGISPFDLNASNFGFDRRCNLKIRDLSRFSCEQELYESYKPVGQITMEALQLTKQFTIKENTPEKEKAHPDVLTPP